MISVQTTVKLVQHAKISGDFGEIQKILHEKSFVSALLIVTVSLKSFAGYRVYFSIVDKLKRC